MGSDRPTDLGRDRRNIDLPTAPINAPRKKRGGTASASATARHGTVPQHIEGVFVSVGLGQGGHAPTATNIPTRHAATASYHENETRRDKLQMRIVGVLGQLVLHSWPGVRGEPFPITRGYVLVALIFGPGHYLRILIAVITSVILLQSAGIKKAGTGIFPCHYQSHLNERLHSPCFASLFDPSAMLSALRKDSPRYRVCCKQPVRHERVVQGPKSHPTKHPCITRIRRWVCLVLWFLKKPTDSNPTASQ